MSCFLVFGIEDSHSIANSLRWGPDGWIYATQGSTVSGDIIRHGADSKPLPNEKPIHSLGQNLWRYHPERHVYEVFAEGGGNAFGVEFDSKGRVFSGHNGGDTRGFHYIQGGYFQKTFGKHGDLSNPYTFGYFPSMTHHSVKRFSHTFAIYESMELPKRYHGKLFGVNPVENYLIHSTIEAEGSSRKTKDIATIVEAGEGEQAKWFTPVDVQVGPDGALYMADWYAVQANHYRNHEGETNPDLGRMIRVRPQENYQAANSFDLESLPSEQLVDQYLSHTNKWFRQQALRILGDRKDKSLNPKLRAMARDSDAQLALESLWALHQSGGLSEKFAVEMLKHANPHVRRWVVRLLGDAVTPPLATTIQKVALLAERETDAETFCQIVCTTRRLSPDRAFPILRSILGRREFADDIHIPLSFWWAVESHSGQFERVRDLLESEAAWDGHWKLSIPANLVKRYAMGGTQAELLAAAAIFKMAGKERSETLVRAFAEAMEGRRIPKLPRALEEELSRTDGVYSLAFGIRNGDSISVEVALDSLKNHLGVDTGVKELFEKPDELQLLTAALGDTRAKPRLSVTVLLDVVRNSSDAGIRNTALVALQKYGDETTGEILLSMLNDLPDSVRPTAESALVSRTPWARLLLTAVDKGNVAVGTLQPETIERLRLRATAPELATLVKKHLPPESDESTFEGRIDALAKIVDQGNGRPLEGKKLFFEKANCGKCHQLFSEGGDVGPDLTPYNRHKIRNMLLAIVQPSAEIREGYENYSAITEDGQIITGLKVEANENLVVLRGPDGQNHSIAMEEVDELEKSKRSLMPAGLLNGFSDEEIRDLFAYLISTTPPK